MKLLTDILHRLLENQKDRTFQNPLFLTAFLAPRLLTLSLPSHGMVSLNFRAKLSLQLCSDPRTRDAFAPLQSDKYGREAHGNQWITIGTHHSRLDHER